MSAAPFEWTCVLLDGPDEGKQIFVREELPPNSIRTPRHLSPKPAWGGLEDPYHYAEMPFREYVLQDYEPELGYAEYTYKEDR